MKKLFVLALALVMCLSLSAVSFAEDFDPAGILDWYEDEANVSTWMTTNNGGWDHDPASAPTDEELEAMFQFAQKSQTGIGWTETFFLVVRDPAAQQGIIGDAFGALEDCANEGTVTVMVLVDNILPQDQHATPYDGASYFEQPVMASFNAGMTCGMLNVAATSLGYSTHYFAYPDGELINGAAGQRYHAFRPRMLHRCGAVLLLCRQVRGNLSAGKCPYKKTRLHQWGCVPGLLSCGFQCAAACARRAANSLSR